MKNKSYLIKYIIIAIASVCINMLAILACGSNEPTKEAQETNTLIVQNEEAPSIVIETIDSTNEIEIDADNSENEASAEEIIAESSENQTSEEQEKLEVSEEPVDIEENADGELTESEGSKESEKVDGEDADPQANVSAGVGSAMSVAEMPTVNFGIDVAKYQGTIDWSQVAASGIGFAMVRVGYRTQQSGIIKEDSNAKYNMQEAQKYGIKVGAYFFSTAINDAEAIEEADWVASYISKYQITYPVAYNCEGFMDAGSRQNQMTKDQRSNVAMTFLDRIGSKGYTPMFYGPKSELSGNSAWNTSSIEKKYKVWLAWYPEMGYPVTNGANYSGKCDMWQCTNKGTIAGIKQPVDLNIAYFGYGGVAKAQDETAPEIATADVEALMNFTEVNENVTAKKETNLRSQPSQGAEGVVVATLLNGQVAVRTGKSPTGWSRVVYNGQTLYAVSSYLTTDFSGGGNTAVEAEQPANSDGGVKTKFIDCGDMVTAKDTVNLRSLPSVTNADSVVVATIHNGEYVTRTGYNLEMGWSRVDYNGQTLYCVSSYLTQ